MIGIFSIGISNGNPTEQQNDYNKNQYVALRK